jgi:hypothetical protein
MPRLAGQGGRVLFIKRFSWTLIDNPEPAPRAGNPAFRGHPGVCSGIHPGSVD